MTDPSLLLLTDQPPIRLTHRHVRLFRDVVDIRPSDFALPLAVRCATRRADEQRMGFAPTAVEDRSGRLLLLNWSADVFDFEGTPGRDVRLTGRRWGTDPLPPIVGEPRDRITYVYADRGSYAKMLLAHCP